MQMRLEEVSRAGWTADLCFRDSRSITGSMGKTPPFKYTDGVNVFGRQVQLFAILHSLLVPAADGNQCRRYPPRAA